MRSRLLQITQIAGRLLPLLAILLTTGLSAQRLYNETEIVQFLNNDEELRLETEDINGLTISSQYYDEIAGVTHVYLQQNFRGIPVKEGTMGLHFTTSGDLFHSTSNFVHKVAAKVNGTKAGINSNQALRAALSHTGIQGRVGRSTTTGANSVLFDKSDFSVWDVPVRLVYETAADGTLQLAWESRIYPLDEANYWELSVDATSGKEIARIDRVIHCTFGEHDHTHTHTADCGSEKAAHQHDAHLTGNTAAPESTTTTANFYRVYDAPVEAPSFGERTFVGTAGDPTSSPLGWHNDGLLDYNITKGNNVYAYHDPGPASTGIPAVGGTPGQSPLVFDFEADLSLTPLNYRDAAITNLFYWNNLIHDIFYHYGFTEPAGNFQQDNFTFGGEGLDGVLAEAQDGSGVNNANFLTLEDGLPGRMQMFLWTSVPLIDGDFDNGVILHEYGHGISTRLTGGPGATCLSGDEQGGEGWSDFFGAMITMQPETVPEVFSTGRGIGTYVVGEGTDGNGIRPAKYSTDFNVNDYTYADLNNAEISAPHGVGFIWATMLWEMTNNLVEEYGYSEDLVFGDGGNNIALQLVMTGLTLQPCGPTFVEQRDAILAADQLLYGGENQCLIWEAFAKRGLGASASSGTNARGDEIPAFDMPASFCQPTVTISTEASSLAFDNSTTGITIYVSNNSSSNISGVNVTEFLPAGTSVATASSPYVQSGNQLQFNNLTIGAASTMTIHVVLFVNTGSSATMMEREDLEDNPFSFSATPGLNQFSWTTADAHSGNYSFFAADPNNIGNQILTYNPVITPTQGTHLRFAHRFNTEADFDGGLVEASNDGGMTWTDLGPLFVENGYNNFVPAANNPLINGFCFAGNSGDFIHSMVDLSIFANQEIQLRFRFASDVATGAEGWYIDDVEIVNEPHVITNNVSFSMANGFVTGSESDDILVLGGNQNLNPTGSNTDPLDSELTVNAGTDQQTVSVIPNPATATTELRLANKVAGLTEISILNAQGQTMYANQSNTVDQFKFNVSEWPAGIYLIRIQQGETITSRKLIVK
ncbi:hypothetical protein CEQ90_13875 [Lewinellaceae bacterium SD302]|nr:hypothetical protein CEQ90_13875 [Lewinellaceae bacterium SD302]